MRRAGGLAALALLGACGPAHLHALGPQDGPLQDDQIALVGRAEFDPGLDPAPSPPGSDDTYRQIALDFARSERGPAEATALVAPHVPFAVVLPRKLAYLRGIRIYAGIAVGADASERWLQCDGAHRIAAGPKPGAVYVGTLLCKHVGETPVGIKAIDEFDALRSDLPRLVGTREVTRSVNAP